MPDMGRPRTRNFDLPPRMAARRLKGSTLYYYCAGVKRIPLGNDLQQARRRWAELENAAHSELFCAVAARYRGEALSTKAPKTAAEQERQLTTLEKAFGHIPLSAIRSLHVRQYLDQRSRKIAANREIALLSHLWNWAKARGYVDGANPCSGIRRHKEASRNVYVTDTQYQAVWNAAPQWLRDAMDLALLTSQRPSDLLKLTRQDIQDGALWLRQSKTGTRIGIEITGRLEALIKRLTDRSVASLWLVSDGGPVTIYKLDHAFRQACKAVGESWQFRDLRAKAISDSKDLREAQQRAGHANEAITAAVYRRVRGNRVKPLEY